MLKKIGIDVAADTAVAAAAAAAAAILSREARWRCRALSGLSSRFSVCSFCDLGKELHHFFEPQVFHLKNS